MATEDTIQSIIDNAIDVANTQTEAAAGYSDAAMTAANSIAFPGTSGYSFVLNLPGLGVNIPANAQGGNLPLFQQTYDQIKNDLTNQFANFFATYFPVNADYLAKAQDWLYNTLTYGGTGINPAVEDQIWERDRARILADSDRIEEEVLITWAGRGFPLPPGAAADQTLKVRQEAQNKIAQASRDVAIKQAEIEIENIRFAVENSLKYRLGAIQAAAEYIKALALGPEIASKLALSAVNAQSELINAASGYYRSLVMAEELRLKALQGNASLQLESAKAFVDAFKNRSANVTHAALASAQTAGNMGAAALNALHSQATLQTIENK